MFPHRSVSVISSQTNLWRLAFPSKLVTNESDAFACVCRAAYYYHIFIRRYRAPARVDGAPDCCWEKRLFLMPISIDSGSSRSKEVKEASGGFVCGRRFLWGGDGWILRRFLWATSSRSMHKNTHHKISDWMAIHTAVHFSTFMFIFGMFEY